MQTDFVVSERATYNQTVIAGNQDYAFEELHKLGCGIGIALSDSFQIHLEIISNKTSCLFLSVQYPTYVPFWHNNG
jgi:hypothetical protein